MSQFWYQMFWWLMMDPPVCTNGGDDEWDYFMDSCNRRVQEIL